MRIIQTIILCLALLASPLAASAADAPKPKVIGALDAWEMLEQEPKNTFIIDIRPRLAYCLVGHPPMAYNIPWRFATTDFQVEGGVYQGAKALYTGYQLSAEPNPNFVGVVKGLFKPADRILVISENGAMGQEAAEALTEAGFLSVYNIRHGFLGDPLIPADNQKLAEKYSPLYGRRGLVNGWVFWGLPVSLKVEPRLVYPPDLKKMQSMD